MVVLFRSRQPKSAVLTCGQALNVPNRKDLAWPCQIKNVQRATPAAGPWNGHVAQWDPNALALNRGSLGFCVVGEVLQDWAVRAVVAVTSFHQVGQRAAHRLE